jgi:hypothetical protein
VSARTKLLVTISAFAVRIAVCAVETGDAFAVNWALKVFAATREAKGVVAAALFGRKPDSETGT